MSKKIHVKFDDGKDYTLIFDDTTQGILSFVLELTERTKCSVVLLSGFSTQERTILNSSNLEE